MDYRGAQQEAVKILISGGCGGADKKKAYLDGHCLVSLSISMVHVLTSFIGWAVSLISLCCDGQFSPRRVN